MSTTDNIAEKVLEIDQLNEKAWDIVRSEPDETLALVESIFSKANSIDYAEGKAFSLLNKGAAYLWLSDFEKAMEFSLQALNLFHDLELYSMEGQCNYTIGTIFFYLSDYENALQSYISSLKNYENGDDQIGLANAYNGIGSVYYTIDENQKALHYLNQSLKVCKKEKAYHIQQKVLDGLGRAHGNLKNYEEAKKALFECLNVIESHNGSSHVKAHALNNIGNILFLQKKYKEALSYYEQSLEIREKTSFKNGIADCFNNIGKLHLKLNQLNEAELFLNQGLSLSKKIQSKDIQVNSLQLLSNLYEIQNKPDEALDAFKLYHQLSETIRSEKSDRRNKSIELKFKMEQEEQVKNALSTQNEYLKKHSEDLIKLSEIGKSLMSLFSPEDIIKKAYHEVNELMDAPSFGLGIFDEKTGKLNFPGYIENGKTFENINYDISDSKRLAIISFAEKKEIIIHDFEKEYDKWVGDIQIPLTGKGTNSIVYLPYEIHKGTSGVMTVQSFKKNAYQEHHINMIRNLSVYMAIALENAQLYKNLEDKVKSRTKELQSQKKELEDSYKINSLLTEVGRQLTSSTDFESIFLKLHENVNQLMDAECFGVRLYKPEKGEIEYKFEIENGVVEEESFSVKMKDEDNYSVICIKNNQTIYINDNLNEYHKYTKKIVVPSGEMPHSLIFHPMSIGDKIIGLITVQSFKKHAYTQQHIDILNTLGAFTAIALDNVNLLENLEDKVAARTQEVVKQKEKIEKTYQNTQLLNEIGREITSSLSITDVIEKVYENINELLDASIIGVGVVNTEKNTLEVKGAIEEGRRLPDFSNSLDNEDALGPICVNRQEEIIINDYSKDIDKYIKNKPQTKIGKIPKSILYIPLKVKDKVIGMISAQSFKKNAYDDYDLNILRNLALYAGTAIENAGLYTEMETEVSKRTSEVVKQKEEIEKTYDNIKLLSKIGQEIISMHDLESIFEKLHKYINELMDATVFSIRVCDYEKNTIDYKYTIEKGKRIGDVSVSLDDIDNYSVWCVKNKKEIFITDHAKDYKKYTKKIIVVSGDLPESLLFCPMIIGDKVIGAITVQTFEKHAYTQYHLDILRTLAAYSAIGLENANLINNMENEVRVRTEEVVKQKEEIEKSYENTKLLSEIGKDISAELSTENIIEKVYTSLNNLMDATVFGIGIYRKEFEDLYFSGAMESGNKLNDFAYSLKDNKISNRCFIKVEEIIINNWQKEYSQYVDKNYDAVAGEMPESMIYLPLVSKGNPIGVLTVQSFEKDIYASYHLDILRSLAVNIASALENAGLYQNLELRVEERTQEIQTAYQNTKLLSQISKDIAESLEVESIIERVYKNINTLMDATSFGIGLYEEEHNRIKMPGFIENGKKMDDFYYHLDDDRLATWCFKNKKEIFISDYFVEFKNYIKNIQNPVSGKDSSSIIYLPLFLKEKIFGILTIQSYQKNAYSEYQLDILRGLASTITTALENARLYENMEDKVRQRTEEVVKQKEIIEEKNKDITDSIRYAQRIQNVMLPPLDEFNSKFKNSFILFKPRDIVSGDFYWLEQIDDVTYIAVVDCTGHGVPGALVSIVGANGLNRCLVELGLRKPADILNKLSEIVTKTFEKTDGDIKDGMDMALCCIDTTNNKIQYAGANNPLWIIRNNKVKSIEDANYKISEFDHLNLIEVKPDKQPIGYYLGAKPFTNHEIQLEEDDRIYLFSDGYADQFGGKSPEDRARGGKKFKYGNLKKLMSDIQKLPMDQQVEALLERFEEWRGDMEQVDDVCMIGIRV